MRRRWTRPKAGIEKKMIKKGPKSLLVVNIDLICFSSPPDVSRVSTLSTLLEQASYQAYALRKARCIHSLHSGEDIGALSIVSKSRLEKEEIVNFPSPPSDTFPMVGQTLGSCQGATAVVPGMVYSVVCDGRLYYCCLGSGSNLARGSTVLAAHTHISTLVGNSIETSSVEFMQVEAPGSPAHTMDTTTTSSATTSPATSPLLRPITAIHEVGPISGSATPPTPSSPSRMSSSSFHQSHLWDDGWLLLYPLPSIEIHHEKDHLAGAVIEEILRMKPDQFAQLMEYLWIPKYSKEKKGRVES